MDDQESGLISKKCDSDRSNAFHMLPHTIEDICTQQSMSTNANTDLQFSPIRHVLPQIPTRSSTLRMAISKQTHREMFASSLGSKQDTSSSMGHQIDLSRDRSAAANSDDSQDQLPLDVGELIPSWKESQQNENDGQKDSDLSASFRHGRQDQQESSADDNIATSGFHSSSSASNIDSYLMNPDHHHLDQHLPPFSPANKESEGHGKGHSSDFMQKISGISMGSRLDRNSPQMSSLPNFSNPQPEWCTFDFAKSYDDQSNEMVALEQVVQKVNNPMMQSGHHSQAMPSARSFESSPNPIKLKIRRDIGAIEQQQQQQQLQHSPHPLQQPPQITPPPSHLSHTRMMLHNHQVPMDFQLHHQQKHLQQHSYMYESSRYVQNQGPKDYYRTSGGSSSEAANSSSSAIQKVPNLHFSSEYQDSSARHASPYSPDQPLSGMSAAFPPSQLQHAHHYHSQQMMSQQLQHQPQYQHYQHHVVAPPTSSSLAHRSSTPLSTAMMVLHGASPSPPIFNCPPQGQQSSLQLSQPAPSPSSGAVRPKTGRAKTNAELKKQLMEKRAGQQVRASGDGSSLASSPSPSQIEVSSPRSDSSPQSDSSFGGGGNSGFQEAPLSLNGMECQQQQQQQCLQPNLSQYVELTREEMQKSNLLWQLGDLVWARVSGHPWWPAMVIADPITNQFVKLAPRGQKSQYHMQFFGEEQERGWVLESSAINFSGKAAFQEFCQIKLQDNKKDRKAYKIPSQHKKAWEASVRSAEKALVMSRLERFAQLATLFFPEYKTKRGGRKPSEDTNKRKSWSDRSSSSDKFAKRSRMETDLILVGGNVEKNDEECSSRDEQHHRPIDSSHIVLPKNVSNQHQAQFTVFCRKKRDAIAQENPSWSTADIDAHLWQQWSQLDDETRSRFIPMGSDFTYLSRMMQNVDVGGGGGESGVVKQTTTLGKMNGFSGEAPGTRIVSSKNMKAEETRGRKKTGPSSNALKNTSSKHEGNPNMSADLFTNPPIVDEVCFICEKPDLKVVQCRGPCRGLFHRECINLPPLPKRDVGDDGMMEEDEEEIVCPQCSSKTHKCCECNEELKQTEATTVLCSVTDCGRFYHRACVDRKFFKTPDKLVCPLHSCLTCRVRNKVKDSELILADEEDLDFYECIRCPAAFHIPGACLATGSKYLAGPFVICSKHFSPTPKTHPLHARFGATWCFTCEKSGGHMLNCESCPAAHHPSCLKISTNPSDLDGWQCPDCIAGINPLHGDVVWVKFGSYRWWPAQIYWPYEVPQNIANLPHEVGEFPVCFFGSRDYLWLNRRRVFPFKVGDKCCREALRKSGGKVFDKAIREAIATYKALKSDPCSSVCATSNIIHLDKNATMNAEVVDNDDDDDAGGICGEDDEDDDDLGRKVKRKRKKLKVPEKDKRVSKPVKTRVRSTRETVKDQTRSDSEKQTNQEVVQKGGDAETESAVPESPVNANRSPMTFLSPQIEKDLSELRAKLKMKKPVDPPAFNKKSFPSAARPSKKSGRERSSKGDSTLISTPSIVSTLINRPLLQSTSLPGVHDTLCSWCGLDGQSSCESDVDDVGSDEMGEKKESEDVKDDLLINDANSSKYLTDATKHEVASCADDEEQKDANELSRSEGALPSDASKEEIPADLDHNVAKVEEKGKDHINDGDNDESNVCGDNEEQCAVTSDSKDASDGTSNPLEHQLDERAEGTNEENLKDENKEDNNNNVKAEVTSGIASEVDSTDLKREPIDDSNQKDHQPKIKTSYDGSLSKNEGFRRRGRLIFCDKGKCSKVYHYKCLRLTKMPHGHWLCPLHQCTICGRVSTHQCSKCPNAFCLEHFPHCLSYMDDGSPICTGHPEAPPISEELVADILEEMAITKEAEAGHVAGSAGHRKTSKHRGDDDEMDDARVEVSFAKVKKRKRSLSISSSSSISSLEHKKKNAKKIKRKKTSEIKDVSFEKRILPSRTQSRERRFLDKDSGNEEQVGADETLSRKANEPVELILPLKEKRIHFKESETTLKIKKDKKLKKIIKEGNETDEKLSKKGSEQLPVERSESVKKNLKLPITVVNLKKDGSAAESSPKRDSEVKKRKSKKLDKDKEHSKKSKDGGGKNKEKDGSKDGKIKKKKRKSVSEDVESRDGIGKHSSKEGKLEAQGQETLALPPPCTSGDVPISSSPLFPSRTPSSPPRQTISEVQQYNNPHPAVVKPSSLLPPPSSPDKSPMFDNSDDEFPELVIDVPM